MLQGEETPSTSQVETDQQVDTQVQPTEEEVQFNSLSGSAQDRFSEMFRRAREAENKLGQVPAYTPPTTQNQETELKTLSNFGVTTDDKLAKTKTEILDAIKDQDLSTRYSGENGLPKYDPNDVADYKRRHPEYAGTPNELLFKAVMYPDEFSANTTPVPTRKPTSLRPVKTQSRQDALTPEFIEERLKQPDGDSWYDANKDEINKVVYNHTQQFKGQNFGGQ